MSCFGTCPCSQNLVIIKYIFAQVSQSLTLGSLWSLYYPCHKDCKIVNCWSFLKLLKVESTFKISFCFMICCFQKDANFRIFEETTQQKKIDGRRLNAHWSKCTYVAQAFLLQMMYNTCIWHHNASSLFNVLWQPGECMSISLPLEDAAREYFKWSLVL